MQVGVYVSPDKDFNVIVHMYHSAAQHPTFKPLFDSAKAHLRALKRKAEEEGRVFLTPSHLVMGAQEYGRLIVDWSVRYK